MTKTIKFTYEQIMSAVKRKDSLDIIPVILKNYKRYFYQEEDIDELLDEVCLDLLGFVDLNVLYKVHSSYKVNNCVIGLKTIIDKLVDYECMDIDFTNVVFKNITDSEVEFEIIS